MNILFLTYGHVSKTRGGIDQVTDVLSKALMNRGHQVYMISSCHPLDNDPLEKYQLILPHSSICSKENIDFLTDFLSHYQIDVIINQSEKYALLELGAKAKGSVPLVSVVHTDPLFLVKGLRDDWDYRRFLKKKWKFTLMFPYYLLRHAIRYYLRAKELKTHHSYFYKNSDAIVLLSERFKYSFLRIIGLDNSPKLFAIPNPLTLEYAKTNVSAKEKTILFVARLDFSPKRLDRVLKVWNSIKNHNGWQLLIAGHGTDTEFYQQLASKYQLADTKFLGRVAANDLYAKAQILCLSSTYEGFGLVLTEALQHCVIPIAFDSFESVHDIIENGKNGFLIKPFDLKTYKETLKELMINDNLRKNVQQSIQKDTEFLNRFSIDHVVDCWEDLLTRIIGKR